MTDTVAPPEPEPNAARLDEMLEEIEGKNAALDQFAKDKLARTNTYDADEDADREEGDRIDGLAVEYRELVGEFDDLTPEQRTKLAKDVRDLVSDVEQRADTAGYDENDGELEPDDDLDDADPGEDDPGEDAPDEDDPDGDSQR